jgi:hypothetical protein
MKHRYMMGSCEVRFSGFWWQVRQVQIGPALSPRVYRFRPESVSVYDPAQRGVVLPPHYGNRTFTCPMNLRCGVRPVIRSSHCGSVFQRRCG